ncbi:MAG: ATP:guanido phosphotransferase [Bacilli bacterium]|nr:ATP:guanido phosphotransferase [Bacilli bacterium]
MSVSDFLKHTTATWMKEDGPESDIVISTRIRVARNLSASPFPVLATENMAQEVLSKVTNAVMSDEFAALGKFEVLKIGEIGNIDREALVEKHLISRNLVEDSRVGAVAMRSDEVVSIMINEEDHLRIQVLYPGFQLEDGWNLATAVDDALEQRLEYAFDEKRGYLTACPTNVGTGIRASVMMHLPGLVHTNQIGRILSAISQVGLVVRGIYGEGSDAIGNLFQISNQLTLGQSEADIIENLAVVAGQIIAHERTARKQLVMENRDSIEDRVCRSFGILANARKIDSKETMQRLSDVRLGIDLGMIQGVSANILKELMVITRPGFLQKYAGVELAPQERDWRRASLIRERLQIDR